MDVKFTANLIAKHNIKAHQSDLVALVNVDMCKKVVGAVTVQRDGTVHGLQPNELTPDLFAKLDALPDSSSITVIVPCGQQL